MKKLAFILLIGFVPFILHAQPYSNKDKALIAARVDTLIQKYMQKSSLAEIGSSKQSLKVIREFKGLFTPAAIIFDDMNAEFDDTKGGYPYKLGNKSVGDYFDGMIEQFSQGIIVNNKNININYNTIDKGEISVALARSISGIKSTGKFSLINEDTLLIKMAVQPNKSVLISGITAIGSNIKVINDKDLDGVVDLLDECPELTGKIELKGCPDTDGDGLADKNDECPTEPGTVTNRGCPATTFAYRYVFSTSAGLLLSQNNLKTVKTLDLYKDYNPDVSDGPEQSEVLLPKQPPFKPAINVNAQLAYYFGKKKFKKNIGVSIGVAYSTWRDVYDISGSHFFFQSSPDDGLGKYGVKLSFNEANEKVSFNMLNFQLMLRYKAKVTSKLAVEGSIGPSFVIFTTNITKFTGNADFEAIFTDPDNGYNSYSPNYKYDSSDVILTKKKINSNLFMEDNDNPNPEFDQSADDLFRSLNKVGFDLYTNKKIGRSDYTGNRTGFGLNAGFDVFYHIKPTIAVKLGIAIAVAPNMGNTNAKYVPVTGSDTPYFSIFGSGAKSAYTSYGLNIGLIFGI